jgi:Na+/H+-dicarboxylate symporter
MADARRLIAPIVFRTVVIGIAKMGSMSKASKVAMGSTPVSPAPRNLTSSLVR